MKIENSGTSSIAETIANLKKGKFVIVMDNEDRENEGDLIMPAEFATEESLAFMIRYSSGVICAPLLADRLEELQLPLMVPNNTEARQCKFTITVDLAEGNTTGISAADRARTIRALGDKSFKASAFNRPGHIFPLLAMNGGVISRAGHTEAAIDIARLAGCSPAGYICEINDDNGRMMRRPQLEEFARKHSIDLITISDLIRYRFVNEKLVEKTNAISSVKTPFGTWQQHSYVSLIDDQSYEALVYGTSDVHVNDTLVHLVDMSVKGSITAQWAQKIMHENKQGVIVFVPNFQKLINVSGELMAKQSMFGMAMQVLKDLGVHSVTVLSSTEMGFDMTGFGMSINGTKIISTV